MRCFFSGHASGDEFFDFFGDMLLHLVGEIVVEAAQREELFKPVHRRTMSYSYRRATIGSTRIARCAGTHAAAIATAVSSAAANV
jgi:hypothetical protein